VADETKEDEKARVELAAEAVGELRDAILSGRDLEKVLVALERKKADLDEEIGRAGPLRSVAFWAATKAGRAWAELNDPDRKDAQEGTLLYVFLELEEELAKPEEKRERVFLRLILEVLIAVILKRLGV
jgi:hypothetical protein